MFEYALSEGGKLLGGLKVKDLNSKQKHFGIQFWDSLVTKQYFESIGYSFLKYKDPSKQHTQFTAFPLAFHPGS